MQDNISIKFYSENDEEKICNKIIDIYFKQIWENINQEILANNIGD